MFQHGSLLSDDFVLVGIVSAIWAALAALYGLVSMFDMPGSARAWGAGAVLFAVLAGFIFLADRRTRRFAEASSLPDPNEASREGTD